MPVDIGNSVRARLTAYIAPNQPETSAQKAAFEEAVGAQAEYESAQMQGVPAGAQSYSMSNDGVSVSVTYAGAGAGYSEQTLSPYAWALLKNAGLLRKGAIPTARRF